MNTNPVPGIALFCQQIGKTEGSCGQGHLVSLMTRPSWLLFRWSSPWTAGPARPLEHLGQAGECRLPGDCLALSGISTRVWLSPQQYYSCSPSSQLDDSLSSLGSKESSVLTTFQLRQRSFYSPNPLPIINIQHICF